MSNEISMNQQPLTYKKNMSKSEVYSVMRAVGIPVGVFCLSLMTISTYTAFGEKLLCPMIGAMWVVGFAVAFLMPSMRKEVINQTMITIAGYDAAMIVFKYLLKLTSGVSSEMIAASFNMAIPTSTGNALPGYIQNIMWFTAVLTPLGFLFMQGKRLVQFKHNQSLQKTFGRVRGMRNDGRRHSEIM